MDAGTVNGQALRAFVERIERTEEEIRTLNDDKKEIYSEAKGYGYDVKIIKKIVGLRRKEVNARREEAELLDLYMTALGMVE